MSIYDIIACLILIYFGIWLVSMGFGLFIWWWLTEPLWGERQRGHRPVRRRRP